MQSRIYSTSTIDNKGWKMLTHADLASLVRALVGSEPEAITVTRWAPISPHIADTQYVFVSRRAAELFCYKDPSELEGQYLSQRHTTQDFNRGAKLSLARHLGYDIAPNVYTSRIITSFGEIRPVHKETCQIDIDGVTYWITKLTPAEKQEPLPDVDLSALGVTTSALSRYRRRFNIAMLENLITESDNMLQSVSVPPILSQKTDIGKGIFMGGSGSLEAKSDTEAKSVIVLYPGGSVRMPQGRRPNGVRPWMHWCQVCDEIWRSDDPEPRQCGRRQCRSFYWKTGVPSDIALESGNARRGRKRRQ